MTLAGALIEPGDPFDINRAIAAESGGASEKAPVWRGDGVLMGSGPWGQIAVLQDDAVVADLRIDNRVELWRALGSSGTQGRDAMLLLLAWRRWGEDCFDRIYGDLACALWDSRQQRLVLARDALASRPLHYAKLTQGGSGWIFSSSPNGILSDARVPNDFDERFLAETITQTLHEPSRAPYRALTRVPPGHGVVLDRQGGERGFRHWHPERIPTLHLPKTADYVEAVRDSLRTAVRACLPPSGAVGCELSSGLDSTTVTALAASELAAQGRSLTAFTSVPADAVAQAPRRINDEGPLAARLAAAFPNIDHQLISTLGVRPLFDICAAHTQASGEMETVAPGGLWADAIGTAARQRGIRVLLVAGAGNITFSYHGLPLLPRLLAERRGLALWRQWRGLARWEPDYWTWTRRLYWTAAPLLPPSLVIKARRLAGKQIRRQMDSYPLNPEFSRATGLDQEPEGAMLGNDQGLVSDGRAWRMSMLYDQGTAIVTRRLHGLEVRDPTADRRLLELCLSIPEEQYLDGGVPRALARRVMEGLVPDAIRLEWRSGLQTSDWHQRYDDARGDFIAEMARLEASPLARRILDLPRLRRLIDGWPDPAAGGAAAAGWDDRVQLLMTQGFGAGLFLRKFERNNYGGDDD